MIYIFLKLLLIFIALIILIVIILFILYRIRLNNEKDSYEVITRASITYTKTGLRTYYENAKVIVLANTTFLLFVLDDSLFSMYYLFSMGTQLPVKINLKEGLINDKKIVSIKCTESFIYIIETVDKSSFEINSDKEIKKLSKNVKN